jgi:hypothetical protein
VPQFGKTWYGFFQERKALAINLRAGFHGNTGDVAAWPRHVGHESVRKRVARVCDDWDCSRRAPKRLCHRIPCGDDKVGLKPYDLVRNDCIMLSIATGRVERELYVPAFDVAQPTQFFKHPECRAGFRVIHAGFQCGHWPRRRHDRDSIDPLGLLSPGVPRGSCEQQPRD